MDRHRLGDRPHERDQFARDRRDGHVRVFAARDEATEALAPSDLGFPADVLNRFRQRVNAPVNVFGDFGGMPIGPGAFDECRRARP